MNSHICAHCSLPFSLWFICEWVQLTSHQSNQHNLERETSVGSMVQLPSIHPCLAIGSTCSEVNE